PVMLRVSAAFALDQLLLSLVSKE
ncbi:MAG: hypothetical protein RL385_2143, partial [Pseudomonadota bacterium]